MAFKKTQDRIRVQPTGLPDFSGYSNAARQYENISDLAFGVGAKMREQKVNDLILEAESAGRTAGATYDSDNNLVPLTNLDLDKAIEDQVFSESEKNQLRQAYRNAALSTYAATVSLDAKAVAENAYNNSPNDPNGVRGALEGYMESLDMDDEVKNFVMPNIVAQFQTQESKANANLILQQKKVKEKIHLENIADLTGRIATLAAKGPGTNPAAGAGMQKMMDELQQELKGSYEALESIGYDETQISDIQEGVNQTVAERVSEAHIERLYYSANESGGNGFSQSLMEIEKIRTEFEPDPNIDQDQVAQGMTNHLQRLVNIQSAADAERSKIQTHNYKLMQFGVELGTVTRQDIMGADLDKGQKTSLLQALSNKNAMVQNQINAADSAFEAVNKDKFDRHMAFIENPASTSPDNVQNSISEVRGMIESGYVSGTDMGKYFKAITALGKEQLEAAGDGAMAQIEFMMGPSQSYAYDEQYFRGMTKDLVERGFIGTGPGARMTKTQWESKLNSYAEAKDKFERDAGKLFLARAAVKSSFASEEDRRLVQDAFSAELVPDINGNIFTHMDPDVRDQNFEKAVRFAMAYNIMPRELAQSLADLESSAMLGKEQFDAKVQLFFKIHDSLISGSASGGTTDLAMPPMIAKKILKDSGINVYDYEVARTFGHTLYRDTISAKGSDTISAERVLRGLDPRFGSLSEAIRANFTAALEKDGSAFLLNNIGIRTPNAEEQQLIRRLRADRPGAPGVVGTLLFGDGVDDAYIGDERILRAVEGLVMRSYASKGNLVSQGEKGLKIAIRDAVMRLAEDGNGNALIGLSVDSDGQPYWTMYPWYQQAKQSIGSAIDVAAGEKTVSGMVFDDIRDKFLSGDYALPEETRRLLQEDGVIFLEPNALTRDYQTYMVKVMDPETDMVYSVASDYRYNFLTSKDFPAYVMAVDTVKNDAVKSFIANLPLMKPVVINSVKAEIDEQWANYKDPGVMNNLLTMIAENNPFFRYERTDKFVDFGYQGPIRSVDEADMAVLVAFMRGEIPVPVAGDAASMQASVGAIYDIRRQYEGDSDE